MLVGAQEVDLDTSDAQLLQPRHLTIASQCGIHAVLGCLWRVVGIAIAVVPQKQLHSLAVGIAVQLDNTVAPYLLIPPVVYQHIFETHGCRDINHLHLIVIVHALVLPDEPAPCVTAWLIVLSGFVERIHNIVGNGGLDNRFQRRTHRDGAPRGAAWQRNASPVTSQTIHLTDIRIGNRIATTCLIVAQVTGTIVGAHTRLADKYPTCRDLEQTRESKALAKR